MLWDSQNKNYLQPQNSEEKHQRRETQSFKLQTPNTRPSLCSAPHLSSLIFPGTLFLTLSVSHCVFVFCISLRMEHGLCFCFWLSLFHSGIAFSSCLLFRLMDSGAEISLSAFGNQKVNLEEKH